MTVKKEAAYLAHLSKDKKLEKVLQNSAGKKLEKRRNVTLHLMRSIMSQQLSTKVAKVIYDRFIDLFDGVEPTPVQVADMPFEQLRSIGLSNAKTHYIQNIARYALEYDMSDKALHKMSDDEVKEFLLPIKGVGKWTVEMLLMFALGREDVFAVDDLGIQQAMIQVYKLDPADKKQLREKMLQLSARWRPYRTYACLHLWEHKDGN
ncbi:MAG: DNA-3-methyladenine glycosylase 2 family protein [Chitinophagaceae bacterium]|nr:DNA-3-methyladenine glycosylase 2 family protein [Chitinophagaceae bacterium]MCB9045257.1 DNA-3-methyladenine glycosylase 2 family protein [Chitinophagales bacterium]